MIVADCVPTFERSQEKVEKPRGPIGAFLQFEFLWRGGLDFGLRAAVAHVGLARRRIFHWRLAPLPFTGRGWKLRSSSQQQDPMFGEAETRFDPDIRYESALCIAINCGQSATTLRDLWQ